MDPQAARSLALEMFPGQESIIDYAMEVLRAQAWQGDPEMLIQLTLQFMEEGLPPPVGIAAEEGMKMVLLIQGSLSMSPGKTASQCVHAALGAGRSAKMMEIETWTGTGEKAVCLNVETEEEMNELVRKAQTAGLNVHSCHDAGRTQVEAGSRTVVAIGPHQESRIDVVTGHLKLY